MRRSKNIKTNRKAVVGMIQHLEAWWRVRMKVFGRVMAKLDELDLAQNTVVVFFSDNGGYGQVTSMDPLRGSKGMLYEGGIREPMIVRWPEKIEAGSVCDTPVIGIDFYPTLLEMAGTVKPSGTALDGESLLPLLVQSASLKRDEIYWHFPVYLKAVVEETWRTTPAGAIRQGDYKLIEFFENGRLELYNLKDDIGEKKNLADAMPEKVRALHARMKQWRGEVSAPVPTEKNPDYVP